MLVKEKEAKKDQKTISKIIALLKGFSITESTNILFVVRTKIEETTIVT